MKVFSSKNLFSKGLRVHPCRLSPEQQEQPSTQLMPQEGNVLLVVVCLVVAVGFLLGIPRIDALSVRQVKPEQF